MAQLLPPASRASTTTVVNGRTYTCALGSVLANVPEFDANALEANGWMRVAVNGSGTTAQRPVAVSGFNTLFRNFHYMDTTVGFVIVYDGANWRNPASGAVV